MSDVEDEGAEHRLGDIEVRDVVIPILLAGAQTAAANKARFKAPFPLEILKVSLSALTAPVGADIIVDINEAGTTLFTTQANRPRITAGSNDSTGVQDKVPDDSLVAAGAVVTVDVDQIGSGTAGSDLMVLIHATRR